MSGGAITFPSIGCRVYNSANISTSDGANKTLTFDSERYDNTGASPTNLASALLQLEIEWIETVSA